MYKPILLIVAALVPGLFMAWRVFANGLPQSPDVELHTYALVEHLQLLRDGQWFPHWNTYLANGYGMPRSVYYVTGLYWLATPLCWLGFNPGVALWLLGMAGCLIGSAGAWHLGKVVVGRGWGAHGELAGFFTAAIFLLNPPLLTTIGIRGALPEFLALMLLPWCWLLAIKLRRPLSLEVLLLAILVMVSTALHLLTALFILVGAGVIVVCNCRTRSAFLASGVAVFLGLGLGAPWWMPPVFESHLIQAERLLTVSNPGEGDGLQGVLRAINHRFGREDGSRSFGRLLWPAYTPVAVFMALLGGALALTAWSNRRHRYVMAGALVLFLLSIILQHPWSAAFWGNAPFLKYIQFPTRLLNMGGLLMGLLASVAFVRLYMTLPGMGGPLQGSAVYVPMTILLLAIFPVLLARNADPWPQWRDAITMTEVQIFEQSGATGLLARGEFVPVGVEFPLPAPTKLQAELIEGHGNIIAVEKVGALGLLITVATTSQDAKLRINRLDFPDWHIRTDGLETAHKTEPGSGLIVVRLDEGESQVHLEWRMSPVKRNSFFLSFFSCLAIILVAYFDCAPCARNEKKGIS